MEEITATEIKNKLGSVMDKAQTGPVGITRRGRREFVFTTARDYRDLLEIKRVALIADLDAGIGQLKKGKISSKSISAIIARAKREHSREKKDGTR
jgi:prevent-host-death family protein